MLSALSHAQRFPPGVCPSFCCFVDKLKQRCLPVYVSPCVGVIIHSCELFTFISSPGCHGGMLGAEFWGWGQRRGYRFYTTVNGHLGVDFCED